MRPEDADRKSNYLFPRQHPCEPIGPAACLEAGCKKKVSWEGGSVELERLVPLRSFLALAWAWAGLWNALT